MKSFSEAEIQSFLGRPSPEVAPALLGCTLEYKSAKGLVAGIITETEAYSRSDPASHTFRGPTKRNRAMFMKPGTIYIYFTYGMHYCMNLVAGNHNGEAVLLRAVQPTKGLKLMQANRKIPALATLTNGPAKLVEAFGIDPTVNETFLTDAGFSLSPPDLPVNFLASERIGISKAKDTLWRFFIPTVDKK